MAAKRRRRRRPHPIWTVLAATVVVAAHLALGAVVIVPAVAETLRPSPVGGVPDAAPTAPVATEGATASAGNAALVDQEWAESMSSRSGIPVRAVLGYAGAEIALRAENPACGIGWTTLAALGRIESSHGRHDGAVIDDDGVTRPGVWGPDLDGDGNALIADSDGGAIDGAAEIDRAVGPLQFIPETWASWGADGDGDGRADPQQIDDAALAAARYLCHYGDLTQPETWRTAIFAYNHLDVYVDDVAAQADRYAADARR
ncbi:hypothetical protein CVS47_03211 [Microbacterium lemovicicum]|uniref:Transglycosylase SLT domain-containing protein n=1 Tax=Microbacterium lemovicicum TaxID=1072463 RepID=A0A3S9WEQ7_9MICO|nr:lytic transglycosylase domain-containing protein [Microbacterium lemovicicum]AZS38553.1 hypothetical protein CVS47_03211 [Microbacterium lemovicicum]